MFLKILINQSYNHLLPTVDFKMSDRKVSVKTLNEQCKALRDTGEKRLSNKDASLTYGFPPNTVSAWFENKGNKKKLKQKNKKRKLFKGFDRQLFDVND